MFMQKRGLSGVITVIMLVLLIMVAIGIIWFVIRPFLQGSLGGSQSTLACMEVDLTIENVICETGKTTIRITRGNDDQKISKINVKFYDNEGSKIMSSEDYLGPAETISITFDDAEIGLMPNKVSVFATLLDEDENDIPCEETSSFDISCTTIDVCGDGIVGYTEECDDGCMKGIPNVCEPVDDGDVCSSTCAIENQAPTIDNLCVENDGQCKSSGTLLTATGCTTDYGAEVTIEASDDRVIESYLIDISVKDDAGFYESVGGCSDQGLSESTLSITCPFNVMAIYTCGDYQLQVRASVTDDEPETTEEIITLEMSPAG